ncbi:hypothetical protein ALNOE001_04620 [Candidatus Methanobinarius endosymbioticus]|uniref:Right handed beta helix domain-containing protein n=1 Tax=Candidatus Methanobinarius endosymbioticus TaxID=2006182 RepID=A0A366MF22_9EURY|nr:hypothetical protein ALNOE001_04620 [Candidatus Methanobinarius endosymbioticus]
MISIFDNGGVGAYISLSNSIYRGYMEWTTMSNNKGGGIILIDSETLQIHTSWFYNNKGEGGLVLSNSSNVSI